MSVATAHREVRVARKPRITLRKSAANECGARTGHQPRVDAGTTQACVRWGLDDPFYLNMVRVAVARALTMRGNARQTVTEHIDKAVRKIDKSTAIDHWDRNLGRYDAEELMTEVLGRRLTRASSTSSSTAHRKSDTRQWWHVVSTGSRSLVSKVTTRFAASTCSSEMEYSYPSVERAARGRGDQGVAPAPRATCRRRCGDRCRTGGARGRERGAQRRRLGCRHLRRSHEAR